VLIERLLSIFEYTVGFVWPAPKSFSLASTLRRTMYFVYIV